MATISKLDCARCGRRTSAFNCPEPIDDGHPVQCVGDWAISEKHAYVRWYIDATWGARQKYLVAHGQNQPSGAGFLDLFSGPGRVRNRQTGDVFDGSPLIALDHGKAPFTRVVLCDLAAENAAALRTRTKRYGDRVRVHEGDANVLIGELIAALPPRGLNLALVDPFALEPLRFETLARLARLDRMDILLNFPSSDIRRNLDRYRRKDNDVLDRAIGTTEWRTHVRTTTDVPKLMSILVRQLEGLGYTGTENRTVKVANRRDGELYRLMLLSKHRLADKIWKDITKNTPSGQRGFGFD